MIPAKAGIQRGRGRVGAMWFVLQKVVLAHGLCLTTGSRQFVVQKVVLPRGLCTITGSRQFVLQKAVFPRRLGETIGRQGFELNSSFLVDALWLICRRRNICAMILAILRLKLKVDIVE